MPVKLQPEPSDFFTKVQKKGEEFQAKTPKPTEREWKAHRYWQLALDDLYTAYSGICAFSCHWIPPLTGGKSVEHFKPKSKYPEEAYHWDNYRLVCGTLNGRKGYHEDVLDPFTLQENWFVLHFPSLQLRPGEHLSETDDKRVVDTIKRLKLNDQICLDERKSWLIPYVTGKCPILYIEEKAPFLAYELKRQQLDDVNHPMWEEYKKWLRA